MYQNQFVAVVFLLCITNSGIEASSNEYSGMVDVRVSEVLTKKPVNHDRSWPPENGQDFAKVNVRIMGEEINGAVLHNLKPDTGRASTKKLRRIIGNDFQNDWMSSTAPKNGGQHTPVLSEDSKLQLAAEKMNFTFVDSSGVGLQVPPQMQVMFRQWMVKMATCPMDFIWEDLGYLFWPRWIKRGVCLNNYSCSWPSGMRCRPSGSRTLKLLRWVCLKSNSSTKTDKQPRNAADDKGSPREGRRRNRNKRNRAGRRKKNGTKRRNGGGHRRRNGARKRRGDKNKKKRIRRLIKKLTVVEQGYICNWELHQYVISDKCTCSCN